MIHHETATDLRWRQVRLRARDGLSLLVRILTPEAPDSARRLLLIHGGCEHGGRYAHVAERLAAHGWTSVIPDHRGHGESDGPRVDIVRFDDYLDDLRQVVAEFCGAAPPVLFAHSFGGLLAARLVETGLQPRALVLSAPLLGLSVPVPRWKLWLGRGLSRIAPQVRFRTGLDPHNMTRDPEFLAQRRADRLIQKQVTVRWFFAVQHALVLVHRDAGRIACPVLALQGTDDRTVNPAALRDWWPHVGSLHKELIELPGHVHELMFESDWAETTDRIADWMGKLD